MKKKFHRAKSFKGLIKRNTCLLLIKSRHFKVFLYLGTSLIRERRLCSDASEIAYSCVIYLQSLYTSGEVSIRFICSKSKVALKGRLL